MATYLEDHPPARTQFHRTRRAAPTGCIVVHTAESMLDIVGDDSGAESVARFISRRTDAAGSYHLIGDRDSIIHLIPFGWEAFGDGTGSNPWAIHISLAMRAADWPHLSAAHRDQLVGTAVAMADMAAAWLEDVHGITVPARRITRVESNLGEPGFISHAERDPGRRSDPGPGFPWAEFLDRYAHSEGVPMPADPHTLEVQHLLADAGFDPGPIDGISGPRLVAAAHAMKNDRLAKIARIAELEAGNVPPDDTADTVLGRELRAVLRSVTLLLQRVDDIEDANG